MPWPEQAGFTMRALILLLLLAGSIVAAPSATAQSRGELLYTTHCIACHTTEMHWRSHRSASNWAELVVQVRRWQDAASLAWTDGDILEVSRYLNDSIYHFEQSVAPISSLGPGGNQRSTPMDASPVADAWKPDAQRRRTWMLSHPSP
jgi:hypothetical protein